DPQLLRRVLQNFLSNALRYTQRGGVLLGARRTGDEVRIEVWDTGPGIPAEQRARIFGEFQRLERPSPWGEKGLGLGLSICDGMRALLGRWGVDCRTARDVTAAAAELRRGPVDLILADYHLAADIDGLQALQQLRAECDPLPPAALITADGSSELKQRTRALGYPLLHKPVKP